MTTPTETGRLCIHVGFGKAASSWLQDVMFNGHPNLNYLGRSCGNYPDWLIKLHYLDDYRFEQERPEISKRVRALLSPDRVNLLSSENFVNPSSIYSQAKRIRETFGSPRIMIVLRHPVSLLESLYKHWVREGLWSLPFEDYLDWSRTPFALPKRKPIFLPDYFYDEVLDYYHRLFSEPDVLVVKYEELVASPTCFMERVGAFLGVLFEDVEARALTKVLEGLPAESVAARRKENMAAFLGRFYEDGAEVGAGLVDERIIGRERVITQDARDRLDAFFAPRCSAYYP